MKIFIATLGTETNTWSPIPTGMEAFRAFEYFEGNGSRQPANWGNIPLIEWRNLAEAAGHSVIESLCAFAVPGGTVVRSVYERLRDRILADLKASSPDLVLFNLHGAMVADGYPDCEGDLLALARKAAPSAVVCAELDLHANLSHAMVEYADLLISYKEYPHTDIADRARELYAHGVAIAEGRLRPHAAVADLRMINKWFTLNSPVREFVDRLMALETRDDLLSISFLHGFAWSDVPDVGAHMLVYAKNNEPTAREVCDQLADEIWEGRTLLRRPPLDDVLDEIANRADGPHILSDAADNPGSGCPGDTMHIARRLIERGMGPAIIGSVWDPIAVAFCKEVGIGGKVRLRIGGKSGEASGPPLDVDVEVTAVRENHDQQQFGGRGPYGDSAIVRAGEVEVLLTSIRSQILHPDAFTALGSDPFAKKIIVLKSAQHFRAHFGPKAAAIHYPTVPGAANQDISQVDYKRLTRKVWPRVEDPHA